MPSPYKTVNTLMERYEKAELSTKEVARRRGNMISMLKPHPEHRDELDKAIVAATEKVQAQRNGVELEAENRKPVIERNRESLNIQASQVLS